mmetsp:Transcript_51817/g.119112  ORF Transcript_51817/g.119112 Transcript_51817/m.119112 type:complete len:226 (+) Transcript_51817:1166-1843(+)
MCCGMKQSSTSASATSINCTAKCVAGSLSKCCALGETRAAKEDTAFTHCLAVEIVSVELKSSCSRLAARPRRACIGWSTRAPLPFCARVCSFSAPVFSAARSGVVAAFEEARLRRDDVETRSATLDDSADMLCSSTLPALLDDQSSSFSGMVSSELASSLLLVDNTSLVGGPDLSCVSEYWFGCVDSGAAACWHALLRLRLFPLDVSQPMSSSVPALDSRCSLSG